jgi:hypothetical protein
MMKNFIRIFLINFFVAGALFAQGFRFSGYMEDVNSFWVMKNNPKWALDGTVTNRINLEYDISSLSLHAGLRNIFEYGDFVGLIPNYNNFVTEDKGYFNLTKSISSETSYLVYSNIDRLYLDYSGENFDFTLGRQRVNVAENLVWNPNDIFNAYNYYNFTYVERPGSDAAKFEYFFSDVSSLQTVAKVNSEKKVTAAGILKINSYGYDFQLLGGVMPDDYVVGAGWSGDISDAGFSGEITYFKSKEESALEKERILAAIELNYTFESGLFTDFSLLFNNRGTTGNAGINNAIFREDLNVKYLTPARSSLFAQAAYPISPLIKGTISTIINPNDKSAYWGTMLKISLTENIDFNLAGQFFSGKTGSEFGGIGSFVFSQIKWNF